MTAFIQIENVTEILLTPKLADCQSGFYRRKNLSPLSNTEPTHKIGRAFIDYHSCLQMALWINMDITVKQLEPFNAHFI